MPKHHPQAGLFVAAFVASLASTIATANGLGPEPTSLEGRYTGFWACNANAFQIQLDLRVAEDGSADATVLPTALNARRRGSSALPAASITGSYDALTSTLSLEGPILPRQSVTSLQGVVQTDAGQFALLPTDRSGATCSALIGARGSRVPKDWQSVSAAATRTPGVAGGTLGKMSIALERSRDEGKTACDKDILAWVGQLRANGYGAQDVVGRPQQRNLFRPEFFEPFFGKRFTRLSGKKLTSASVKLTGSCTRDARYSELVNGAGSVADAFLNLPGFPAVDVAIAEISYAQLQRWSASAKQYLAALPLESADPATIETIAARAAVVLSTMWPTEQGEFAQNARAEFGRLVTPWLERQLQAALEQTSSGDPNSLLRLSGFLAGHRARIDKLNVNDQNKIAAMYQSETDSFLKADLARQTQKLMSLNTGKDALMSSASWYREHEMYFALFSELPSVNALYRALIESRQQSFDIAASGLAIEATNLTDRGDLNRFSMAYLIALDAQLVESAPVRSAVSAKNLEIYAHEQAEREQAYRETFFTSYELSLMTKGFGSVVIPDQLQAPVAQGITFALVRARAQRGYNRDTPVSIDGRGARTIVSIKNPRCSPDGSRYRCQYTAVEEITYASSALLSMILGTRSVDELSFSRNDLFEMTSDGWQSATIVDWLEERAQALARMQQSKKSRSNAGAWDDWDETKRQAKEHQDLIDVMITMP